MIDIPTYLQWSCNALAPVDPIGADCYLRAHMDTVKATAQHLLEKIGYTPRPLWRGIVLHQPISVLEPHPNFTYLSFSENPRVAHHFGDPGPMGFPSLQMLGDYGYVINHTPKLEDVLFHHKFLSMLPYAELFRTVMGFNNTVRELQWQQEVMVLQPKEAFREVTPVRSFCLQPT